MRNSLCAIVATLTPLVALVTPAEAVVLSASGTGQALIFPYFTARTATPSGPNATLVTIVNGTQTNKALKVRLREGRAGAPVFDFNLFLPLYDVWAAAITPTLDGAVISTVDGSCTLPAIQAPGATQGAFFRTSAFHDDGAGNSADRTREGWFEVVEMGTYPAGSALDQATQHISGVASCALPDEPTIAASLTAPSGGLFGSASIVNVLEGTAYSYDATALDQWRNSPLYTSPGNALPDITSATPAASAVLADGSLHLSYWSSGADAVSAVLIAGVVRAEYSVEPWIDADTDVVVVMPTRHAYVDGAAARAPFATRWSAEGACEPYLDFQYDRYQRGFSNSVSNSSPQGPSYLHLCWTASMQTMRRALPSQTSPPSAVDLHSPTSSRNRTRFINPFSAMGEYEGAFTIHPNGYTSLRFAYAAFPNRGLVPLGPTTVVDATTGAVTMRSLRYEGLPVVGASFVRYRNSLLTGPAGAVLSNYGSGAILRYERSIVSQ